MVADPDAAESANGSMVVSSGWRIRPYNPMVEAEAIYQSMIFFGASQEESLKAIESTEGLVSVEGEDEYEGLRVKADASETWSYLKAMLYRADWHYDRIKADTREVWVKVPEEARKENTLMSKLAFWRDDKEAGKYLPEIVKFSVTSLQEDGVTNGSLLKVEAPEGMEPLTLRSAITSSNRWACWPNRTDSNSFKIVLRLPLVFPRAFCIGKSMHVIWGKSAHSDYRLNQLLNQLSDKGAIAGLASQYVYFVDLNDGVADLSADGWAKLRVLLNGSDAVLDEQGENGCIITPRLGTISPWASKATDITHTCGLDGVHRIERGIVYYLKGVDESARQTMVTELYDRMMEQVSYDVTTLEGLFRIKRRSR